MSGKGIAWKPAVKDAGRVALWGMGVWLGVLFLGRVFEHRPAGALGVQFVLAEFGLGRLGVAWSDPSAAPPTSKEIASRGFRGASFGLGAAALVVLASLATGGAKQTPAAPSSLTLLFGLLVAAATAARDELLLRGFPLRVMARVRTAFGPRGEAAALAVVVAVGAAAAFGAGGSPREAVLGAIEAAALGALWMRDRGAWMAFGANAAFQYATKSLVKGGAVSLESTGPLDFTLAPPSLAVLGILAAIVSAAALLPRRR